MHGGKPQSSFPACRVGISLPALVKGPSVGSDQLRRPQAGRGEDSGKACSPLQSCGEILHPPSSARALGQLQVQPQAPPGAWDPWCLPALLDQTAMSLRDTQASLPLKTDAASPGGWVLGLPSEPDQQLYGQSGEGHMK